MMKVEELVKSHYRVVNPIKDKEMFVQIFDSKSGKYTRKLDVQTVLNSKFSDKKVKCWYQSTETVSTSKDIFAEITINIQI